MFEVTVRFPGQESFTRSGNLPWLQGYLELILSQDERAIIIVNPTATLLNTLG